MEYDERVRMTGTKYVILATILTVVIITCLGVPVVAANSASGNSSNSASKIFHHYNEGICLTNIISISNNAVTPTSVIPAIPPQVPFSITPVNDLSPTPVIGVTRDLPATASVPGLLKKNDETSLVVTVTPVATPGIVDNASLSEPASGMNSSNSSQIAPANNSTGTRADPVKQGKHWLDINNTSVKNLTREDPLYASWTSHLETPRAITLNNSAALTTINRSGKDRPITNTPGNLKQDQPGDARGTAHQQINTLSQRMELFKAYVSNSSSLTNEDKALLITEAENSTLWLSGKDAEIRSATDSEAAQHLADVESLIPIIEADLQRNAGLLACNEINNRIGEALNVSVNLSDRIGQMGLSDQELLLARGHLADCREHLLNASLYSDRAAETFQGIDGSENSENRYLEGLSLIQQSREELNMAYMTINKLFHLTVEHNNTNTNKS